jgi:hypothetical protein
MPATVIRIWFFHHRNEFYCYGTLSRALILAKIGGIRSYNGKSFYSKDLPVRYIPLGDVTMSRGTTV